jgi:flagellar biosynthesis protein FlhF
MISKNMTLNSNVKVYKGRKMEEIFQNIQKDHRNFKVLDTHVKREMPYFWRREIEMKVLFETEVEKPRDLQKEKLIQMLSTNGTENEKKEVEEMKMTISKLMSQIENHADQFLQADKERYFLKMYKKLLEIHVEENLAKEVLIRLKSEIEEVHWDQEAFLENKLCELLSQYIHTTGPFSSDKIKIMALIGPTGVGKTTTIAKIAGTLKKQARSCKIGLITTDVYRIAAIEQLETYASILGSKLIAAANPQELKDAIDYFKNVKKVDYILIDTVGRSPMQIDAVTSIHEYLEIAKPDHTSLVLSSTQKHTDMLQILANFKQIPIDSLMFTKLDETASYGFMLNVLHQTELPVSYVTNGQSVPDDIHSATSEGIAKKMIIGVDQFGPSLFTS